MPNNPWEPQGSYYNPQTGKYESGSGGGMGTGGAYQSGAPGVGGAYVPGQQQRFNIVSSAKPTNPEELIKNRILASESNYKDAQDYYRSKAEEMQGRAAPTMDWSQAQGDYAAYQADRARQQAFADQLQAQAEGRGGPSVAEMQMQAGLATGQQNARAMAASARGGSLAQAASNRLAMQQAGNAAGQATQQGAVLRAQEQAQARGEYAQMLAGMQAQNAQQRGLSQGQTVATAQNEAAQRGRNDAMAGTMYGQEGGARDALYSGQVTQRGQDLGYAQSQNALNQQKAINDQNRSDQKISSLLGTAATIGGAALMFSDVRLKDNVAPAVPGQWSPQDWSERTAAPPQWSPKDWAAQTAAQQPQTQQAAPQGMSDYQKLGLASQIGGSIGNLGGAIMSDEETKTNAAKIEGGAAERGIGSRLSAAASPLAEQMRQAPAYSYEYRQPEIDGQGERFGPMAQDLARTESGRTMVVETPRGLAIDGKAAIPNLMAQTATLQAQLDEMRAKLAARKGGK